MAVTASTVNTTDTLETLRVQFNNLNSDVVTIDNTITAGSSVAADNEGRQSGLEKWLRNEGFALRRRLHRCGLEIGYFT